MATTLDNQTEPEQTGEPEVIQVEVPRSRGLGAVMVIFGVAAIGAGALWLAADPLTGGPFLVVATPYVLILVGAGLVVGGLILLTWRQDYIVSPEEVTAVRSILGIKHVWREWTDSYEGLLLEDELSSGPGVVVSRAAIMLWHPNPKRKVCLASDEDAESLQSLLIGFCRLLGLPALTRTAEGMRPTAPEDVGRPVIELLVEGKLGPPVGQGNLSSPPVGVEVCTISPDVELVVTANDLRFILVMAAGAGVSALAVHQGFHRGGRHLVYGVLGIAGLLAFPGCIAFTFAASSTITLRGDRIELGFRLPLLGRRTTRTIKAVDVDDVYVGRPVHETSEDLIGKVIDWVFRSNDGVVISTGKKKITLGEGLSRDGLEWLKACILSHMSRHSESVQ